MVWWLYVFAAIIFPGHADASCLANAINASDRKNVTTNDDSWPSLKHQSFSSHKW